LEAPAETCADAARCGASKVINLSIFQLFHHEQTFIEKDATNADQTIYHACTMIELQMSSYVKQYYELAVETHDQTSENYHIHSRAICSLEFSTAARVRLREP